jgi:hypothetical protein
MRFGRVTIRLKWRSGPKPEASVPSVRPPAGEPVTDQPSIPDPLQPPPIPASRAAYRWHHKLLGLLAVIVCFELGIFLIVFPWASDWDLNYFSSLPLWFQNVWRSAYFRGAVSGVGVLNVWISFIEVFRLRRFSSSSSSSSAIN